MNGERVSSMATIEDAVLAGWVVMPPSLLDSIVRAIVLLEMAVGDTVDVDEYTDFVEEPEVANRIKTLRRRAHGAIKWNGTAVKGS